MSRYIFSFVILLFIYSCKEQIPEGFNVSGYDKNGNIIEISKKLKDTLIQDSIFHLKFIKKYDSTGNLLNEGIFAENNRLGKHLYYKNNHLISIKHYVFFNKNDSLFFFATNSFGDSSKYSKYKTYLNGIIILKDNGDTSYEKSSFIDIIYNKIKNDSIKFDFTAYDAEYKISAIDLYFYNPNNHHYVIIVHKNGNKFNLKLRKKFNEKYFINGYAIVTVFNINNASDTTYKYTIYMLNKNFNIY